MIALMGAFWTTHDESRPGQHSFDSRQLPHDTWFTCVAKRNKVRTPKTNAGCDDIVGGRRRQTLNCTAYCSQAALTAWCLSNSRGLSNSSYLADTTRKGGKTCARTATTEQDCRWSFITVIKKGLYHPTPTSTLPYFAFDTCFKRFLSFPDSLH